MVHLIVEFSGFVIIGRTDVLSYANLRGAVMPAHRHALAFTSSLSRKASNDRDWKLKALCGVNRHDANGIVVMLGKRRIACVRALSTLQRTPAEE